MEELQIMFKSLSKNMNNICNLKKIIVEIRMVFQIQLIYTLMTLVDMF